jgi:hypothetical protein
MERIRTALGELEGLVGELRAYPNVPGLRRRAGRGRPKEELLTLIWQTLRAGGLTYREIAELAPPSDGGDNVEELINRIEKRVKDEMPWVTDNRPDERFIVKVGAEAVANPAQPGSKGTTSSAGISAPPSTPQQKGRRGA